MKGERAPASEVPILTVAPHSSYIDAIPVTMTMCSIVAKLESRNIPVWGSEYSLTPADLNVEKLVPLFEYHVYCV